MIYHKPLPFSLYKRDLFVYRDRKTKAGREKQVFLLDKFDQMSLPITKALNIPSFSCLRQGFGEDAKIVGGYMATDEISARTAADFSVRLMNKEKIGMPKIRDMEKEYVLDWTYFSAYTDFDVKMYLKMSVLSITPSMTGIGRNFIS